MDVLQLNHAMAAALRLRKMEPDPPPFLDRRFDLVHARDLLELGLSLGGFAGLGAKPVGKILELINFLLLIFVGGQQLNFVGFTLREVILVVAAIPLELGLPDLNDAADEIVQEGAIV